MTGTDRAIHGFSAIIFTLMGGGFLALGVSGVVAGIRGAGILPMFIGLLAMSVGGLGLTTAYAAWRSFLSGEWH